MGLNHIGAGQLGAANQGFNSEFNSEFSSDFNSGFGVGLQDFQAEPDQAIDSMDAYFECITTCSLDDGACVTRCVEQLREHS